MGDDDDFLAGMGSAMAEAGRREGGDFDGLLGQVPSMDVRGTTQVEGKPRRRRLLLADIVSELRDYLLAKYPEDRARELLAEHAPPTERGWRRVTPVDDDVRLVLRLLNTIASAMRCEGQQRDDLVFGIRDANRQAGVRKERRKEITQWIAVALDRDPNAKSPDLWNDAPEWLTDQIGQDRFKRRVTDVRKTRRK